MTDVLVADGGGDCIQLVDVNGYRLCNFNNSAGLQKKIFDNVVNIQCREDDVFVCAPVKSGTHWMWEIVSMLLNRKAETIATNKTDHMLESRPAAIFDALPSPRILNTHLHFHLLPREVTLKGCKMVYVLRNPKDLAVSYFNHLTGITCYSYEGKWDNFLPLFLRGKLEYNDWFEYVREWERVMTQHPEYPIHLVYYEDLKEQTLREVKRLAAFLGVPDDDGLLSSVTEKCQFHNMQKDKVESQKTRDAFYKRDFKMYRKGDIGDWKNWFTVAQSEHFDKIYEENMKSSSHQFRYTYMS